MTTIVRCLECRSEDLRPHCHRRGYASPTCDLWECEACRALGTIDGRLWTPLASKDRAS